VTFPQPLPALTRRTSMDSVRAGLLLVVGTAAITLVGCTDSSKPRAGSPSPAQSATTSPTNALAKGFSLGSGEFFDPPPANAHPRLSATEAWEAYAARMHARINRDHIPPGTTARLGVFTGGGLRRLAYGYFTPNSAPVYSGPVAPSPPVLCTQWTMLSARTGDHIESSWFRCPPTQYSPVARSQTMR
jgi:hypothetical protein